MSEGTTSARRILDNTPRIFPHPITVPDLELQELDREHETESDRIKRVLGPKECTNDCNQGRNCTCTPKQEKPSLWKSWRW